MLQKGTSMVMTRRSLMMLKMVDGEKGEQNLERKYGEK